MEADEILRLRPDVPRPAAGQRPLDLMVEQEVYFDQASSLTATDVLTVFLRGSECTFRCLMCDLWKHTHQTPTQVGAIASQVRWSLEQPMAVASQANWIKLYNASNFFSPKNVPVADLEEIASAVHGFERVVVENHPRLLTPSVVAFNGALAGRLEMAMGLETIHPQILERLNKQMTLADFQNACGWLRDRDIDVRAFVLLRPPWLDEEEGVEWCLKSLEFAEANGVRHTSVVPLRSGNGALERLRGLGEFETPLASSLEQVMHQWMQRESEMIVTADLWDFEKQRGTCASCISPRRSRLESANQDQVWGDFGAAWNKTCPCLIHFGSGAS